MSELENYQEYGLLIYDMMLNDEIKRSESYQMFIKYSTGLIPPKKSRGKGSQGKKTADVFQETVDVSKESEPEPAKKKTEYKSDMSEDSQLNPNEQDKKNEDDDGDNKGEDDDHISDIQKYDETESDEEDIYKEINLEDDAERKTAEEDNGDEEPTINVAVTLKEILGIPTTNSRQSVSFGFINQFFTHSFDVSLTGTVKDTAEKHVVDLSKQHIVKQAPESSKTQIPIIDLNQEPIKIMSEIHKIKKEQAEKQKLPKYTIKSTNKAALKEYDQKSALYQTMHGNKMFNRNTANHALYHALMKALIADEEAMDKGVDASVKHQKRQHDDDDDDEDPSAGPNQGKMTKRRRTKESNSSNKPSTTKETSKGKAPTKSSKTSKSITEKEPVEEPIAEVVMDNLESTANEDVVNVVHQSQDDVEPKTMRLSKDTWFKQPPRPPTPNPE
nr:hypothetical protein [Tanacetum cinerariifolium]